MFSEHRYPFYFGGFDNGKTFGMCLRAIIASIKYPNNRGVICRRLVKELEDTTRKEFFYILGCNEVTIKDHPYVDTWRQDKNMLRFKNGSEIRFRHLSDDKAIAALKSMSIRWFAIDQAEEVPEAAFLMLISRIGRTDIDSVTGEKLPPAWGSCVGNPKGHGWVWRRAIKNKDSQGLTSVSYEEDGKTIHTGMFYHMEEATTLEGPLTSPSYVATLKADYPERWYKRYVLGSWDVDSGRVYDEFVPSIHVIPPEYEFPIPDKWKAGIGCDLGYNHPTVFIWVAVDYYGNWYAYDEHVYRELTPEQHAGMIKEKGIWRKDGSQLAIYGPHDVGNRNSEGHTQQQLYFDQGVQIRRGSRLKPVVRIQMLKQKMRIRTEVIHPFNGKPGSPQLFIFGRKCPELVKNVDKYYWKELKEGEEESKEEPDDVIKAYDDEWDAFGEWAIGWGSRNVPNRTRPKTIQEMELAAFTGANIENDLRREVV